MVTKIINFKRKFGVILIRATFLLNNFLRMEQEYYAVLEDVVKVGENGRC